MPLRVAIDTTSLQTGSSFRGIGVYTRNLLTELRKLPELDVQHIDEPEKLAAFKPQLIHYPYFDFFFNTLLQQQNVPIVVTIHDVIPLRFWRRYWPGFKGVRRLFQQRKALKKVDHIITDSQVSLLDINHYLQIPTQKITSVHLAGNPAITKTNQTQINRVKSNYRLPEQYVLYVGDINYNKNIPELIKMLTFLSESIHLVCVGRNFKPQPIAEWGWIEQSVASYGLKHRVHFIANLGSDANQVLSALYTGAVAYVQPSLWEGFGLPVLEALQTNTPVVCSNQGSLPEVGGEVVILVKPQAQGFATGVKQIQTWSSKNRAEFVARANKWLQQFSWSQTAEQTAQVYSQVLS